MTYSIEFFEDFEQAKKEVYAWETMKESIQAEHILRNSLIYRAYVEAKEFVDSIIIEDVEDIETAYDYLKEYMEQEHDDEDEY